MDKNEILIEIDKVFDYIENIMKSENKGALKALLDDLKRLKNKVMDDSLVNNPLKGFPRRYAEMYNDYLHPITNVLDKMEKYVDIYLDTN
ncbi:hypothetical protein [Pantoea cypripedii]|uniref:Uncharacterized protein n=1 Tax=Pantoea cypripedii TaxID=55209 RepID=A0A6B9FY61_PANCY|nr:hypothetical protein [Pantoea cypripedii]QGY29694.1 hypothetical protein CUN67_12440 [Pantoea cypripedii]